MVHLRGTKGASQGPGLGCENVVGRASAQRELRLHYRVHTALGSGELVYLPQTPIHAPEVVGADAHDARPRSAMVCGVCLPPVASFRLFGQSRGVHVVQRPWASGWARRGVGQVRQIGQPRQAGQTSSRGQFRGTPHPAHSMRAR